ncbi:hypothetical protein GE09DRAFT_37810 [Coniochaeta sp. 2T2.1]|nr:hypothetical protein GE09DRAFT_37810 [Coniochaeta sp. 2T2.1]
MPEWDSLPADLVPVIIRRLRRTAYPPGEPSGHSSWKKVTASLKKGLQPDWVSLITATFVWRVKQKRPDTVMSNALPDAFVDEANLHTPPVDIQTWPTKGMTEAEWQPKNEPIQLPALNNEHAAQDGQFTGFPAPQLPDLRAATETPEATHAHPLVRPQTVGPESFLQAQAPGPLGPVSGNATLKREYPASDFDSPAHPPAKRPTTTRVNAAPQPNPNAGLNPNLQHCLTEFGRRLNHLTRDQADTARELVETKEKLSTTTKKLEDATTEISELRAIANSNRRFIKRTVENLANGARDQENLTARLRREWDGILENM